MRIKSSPSSFTVAHEIVKNQKENSLQVDKIKLCKNCGDTLSNTKANHQTCCEACRQEIKIKQQVSSIAYTNLITL